MLKNQIILKKGKTFTVSQHLSKRVGLSRTKNKNFNNKHH